MYIRFGGWFYFGGGQVMKYKIVEQKNIITGEFRWIVKYRMLLFWFACKYRPYKYSIHEAKTIFTSKSNAEALINQWNIEASWK